MSAPTIKVDLLLVTMTPRKSSVFCNFVSASLNSSNVAWSNLLTEPFASNCNSAKPGSIKSTRMLSP